MAGNSRRTGAVRKTERKGQQRGRAVNGVKVCVVGRPRQRRKTARITQPIAARKRPNAELQVRIIGTSALTQWSSSWGETLL